MVHVNVELLVGESVRIGERILTLIEIDAEHGPVFRLDDSEPDGFRFDLEAECARLPR